MAADTFQTRYSPEFVEGFMRRACYKATTDQYVYGDITLNAEIIRMMPPPAPTLAAATSMGPLEYWFRKKLLAVGVFLSRP